MSQAYAQFIKELREKRGFSQQEVANRLEIARTSYLAVEQGKRELTLSEAHKLADMFGIDIEDLESGMIPDYEKYKQMLLAYIRMAGSDRDGCIPKTKLAKLLYLADFAWYYEHLESMSGMKYKKLPYGPVPIPYFQALTELEEEGLITVKRNRDSILIGETDASKKKKDFSLSVDEMKLMKAIARKWKKKRTPEIVKFTHDQMPYFLCRDNEVIPYELITQEDPSGIY
ncbi:DUF4065 domain-containing protein [Patescibacteria group bacterium]|nr:DUF4065 domain-containing protein [Patescibacteria group bacterium]MBU1721990.1 DUF4065 domain-containing protein [Patescibacteria group bacterium]MBU1901261.1 DUF4065 domain-containing protein [Patescibacteria group bacterium]